MQPVLIIDDNKDIQEIYTLAFQDANIPSIAIEGGLEALAKVKKINPSIILLDLLMPGDISGIQFMKMLSEKSKLLYPVIACTNLSSKETMDECMALGCLDYIIKANTDVSTIVAKVQKFLAIPRN